jgi:predicted XRE-type DNA-binding protein
MKKSLTSINAAIAFKSCKGEKTLLNYLIHTIIVKKLFDQINMSQNHSATAVTLQTKRIQRFTVNRVNMSESGQLIVTLLAALAN